MTDDDVLKTQPDAGKTDAAALETTESGTQESGTQESGTKESVGAGDGGDVVSSDLSSLGSALSGVVSGAVLPSMAEGSDSEAVGVLADAAPVAPKLDSLGRSYATGKRKRSIARVWLRRGSGKIVVNGKASDDYFARPVLRMLLSQPLVAADCRNAYDIMSTVRGGGLAGQAGALRHGISRALVYFDPDLRSTLKQGGFLTRDSRVVERKKYGHRKARRSFQFSKR